MKKKILTIIFFGILCISMAACNKFAVENTDQTKKVVDAKYDDNGVELSFPDKWKSSQGKNLDMYTNVPIGNIAGQIVISYISDEIIDKANKINTEADKIPETDKEANEKAWAELTKLLDEFKEICSIVTIDKSKTEGDKQKELFSKYDSKDLIGQVDNFEFYLLYNDSSDVNGLSEKSQKVYQEFHGEIKNFKSLINTYKPISETEKVSKNKIAFKTKSLDGKEIDSSILKNSKLTMINVWSTYCNPCIEEMPDLQKLYEELKNEGVNLIGVVSDTPDEDNEALAKAIISKTGVQYVNIIPDETLVKNVLPNISAVPTTIFVDREGNIIGDLVVGSRSKEDYKKEIQDRLKSMN